MVRRLMLLGTFATMGFLLTISDTVPAGAFTSGKAMGGGTLAFGDGTLDFTLGVVQNAAGVHGGVLFSANSGAVQEQLAPTCLYVNGNLATIRATVVSSTFGGVGQELMVFVEDNGRPHSLPPSAIAAVGADPYPTGCAFGPNSGDQSRFLSLSSGNLVVSG